MAKRKKATKTVDREKHRSSKREERKGEKKVYDKRYAKKVEVVGYSEFIDLAYSSQDTNKSKDERLTKGQVTVVFDSFIDVLKTALVGGDRVTLTNFGTFNPLRECAVYRKRGWDCYRKKPLPPYLAIISRKIFRPSRRLLYNVNKRGKDYVFETYFGDNFLSDNTEL